MEVWLIDEQIATIAFFVSHAVNWLAFIAGVVLWSD